MSLPRPMIIAPIYSRLMSHFPQNFTFCFAYGSAVKKQMANSSKDSMIDLIFCVDNPSWWHQSNIKTNSSHYSALKYFGHNTVAKFQENVGARVYFNTLVPLEGVWIKYGVVATKDLITDLLDWSDLYLAGRLHKPVEIIRKCSNPDLQTALQLNLQSAVHAALLFLPENFSEYEFYHTISNISYSGDFRMTFGENKHKVENIVRPQLTGFRNLYGPFVRALSDYVDFPVLQTTNKDTEVSASCCQDVSPLAKLHHLNQLPRWPQKALTRFWNKGALRQDTEDVLRAIAYDPDCNLIVEKCIHNIVFKSSASQSLKKNMHQFSDSDSYDSDQGIRFKTDSTRSKYEEQNLSSSKDKRARSRSPRRRRHVGKSSTIRTEKTKDAAGQGPALPRRLLHKPDESRIDSQKQRLEDKSPKKRGAEAEIAIEGPALPPNLLKKPAIGPQLPVHLTTENTHVNSDSVKNSQTNDSLISEGNSHEEVAFSHLPSKPSIGPQLPPHLIKSDPQQLPDDVGIEPQLPPEPRGCPIGPKLPTNMQKNVAEDSESDDDVYGPLPVDSAHYSKAQIALEERALQLKINQMEPTQDQPRPREEWMLELPEVKAEKFGLGPRQFRSKAGPDMSDRSSWTETPDNKKPKAEKVDLKMVAENKEIKKRDAEQEKMSRKYKKKNKESLLELHQSNMKKMKKEEGPSERRPFSRELDLQVNRFDEAQKKAVLKKAQLLDDRFSSGQSKFL